MTRSTYDPPIDKDVPLPPVNRRRCGGAANQRRYVRIPYRAMQIGDSVFIPEHDSPNDSVKAAIQRYIWRTETAMRFETRKWIEHMIEGTRVWRTK